MLRNGAEISYCFRISITLIGLYLSQYTSKENLSTKAIAETIKAHLVT